MQLAAVEGMTVSAASLAKHKVQFNYTLHSIINSWNLSVSNVLIILCCYSRCVGQKYHNYIFYIYGIDASGLVR